MVDVVYECNLVNDHVGHVIRGETPFEWPDEGWITAPADFPAGKEIVIQSFQESCERIIKTIDSFTPQFMEEPLMTEDGETTRFARCQFLVVHLWYHSGQLNLMQSLLGDDGWHWN